MFNEKTSVLYQTRYCDQEDFSIAVRTYRITFSWDSYDQIGLVTNRRYDSKLFTCGSDLFMISKTMGSCIFEKYSESCGKKIVLPSLLDKRSEFCVCSFMQKIYVIGGQSILKGSHYFTISSCICYETETKKWSFITSMIINR